MKKISKREFLKTTLLLLTSGKVILDTAQKQYSNHLEDKIINELPNYTYKVDVEIEYENNKEPRKLQGMGIRIENYFITMAHITHAENTVITTPFGKINVNKTIKKSTTKYHDQILQEIYVNKEEDLAIYKASIDMQEFPCKPTGKRNIGDLTYIIGNPRLLGKSVRKGNIVDNDGFGGIEQLGDCFIVSQPVYPGDSGTPVVNKHYELIGLGKATYTAPNYNTLNGIKPIEDIIKYFPNNQAITALNKVRQKIRDTQ